jgi:hypothetical protein
MSMDPRQPIRQQLARVLDWSDAHVTYDAAVEDFPADLRGVRPPGFPHSAWELIEHIRITQRDILDFCRPESYREMRWPAEYWPKTPAPPTPQSWNESVAAYVSDRNALQAIATNPQLDPNALVPHGKTQTFLRELLLVADHTAYHVGQLILVRRALGAWTG